MITSIENMNAGIAWWQTNMAGWGADIMNAEYLTIYSDRDGGVTELWWEAAVDRLWIWKAIRGPRPPNSKRAIFDGGVQRLNQIAEQYNAIQSLTESEPTICDVSWEDIQELYRLSHEIKWDQRRNASPVFACKMCHFLFPKIFPIIDNLATGIFEYEFYWRGRKDEWERFPLKEEAQAILAASMEVVEQVHTLYPWETKIMELSHVGYTHG